MTASRSPGYIAGDHWNTCQRCGQDIRLSASRKEWTGLIVCKSCWEPRHPQDFVRGRAEDTRARGLVTGEGADISVREYYVEDSNDYIDAGYWESL